MGREGPPGGVSSGPEPAWIREQFSRIAGHYDQLNRLISLGLEQRWRRELLARAEPRSRARVLDVGAGTGELTRLWLRQHPQTNRVILADFCTPMLLKAHRWLRGQPAFLLAADALQLPLPDQSFEVVMCGFSLRNMKDWRAGITEMYRVLRPGGELLLLEMCRERWPWPVGLYVRRVVPFMGRCISGEQAAYSWLPRSLAGFATAEEVVAALYKTGFTQVQPQHFFLRACTGFYARKR